MEGMRIWIGMWVLATLTVAFAYPRIAEIYHQESSIAHPNKDLLEQRMGNGTKVDSIKAVPGIDGLFEVQSNGNVIYVDADAKHLINGHIFDLETKRDLTQARIEEINKVEFSKLPLDKAIKTVKGDGKRVIAIFEDPNCGYCKRLQKTTLHDIDNVTIYTFLYDILSPDSVVKARDIWCAPNPSKAWDDWMSQGKQAPTAPTDCAAPYADVLALGKKLRVSGTPTTFFKDGSRITGALDAKAFEVKLALQH